MYMLVKEGSVNLTAVSWGDLTIQMSFREADFNQLNSIWKNTAHFTLMFNQIIPYNSESMSGDDGVNRLDTRSVIPDSSV